MKLSYRITVFIFWCVALLPVIFMMYLVQWRIEQRQLALQLFLQYQIDVDRRIIASRGLLREVQPHVRNLLLKENRNENDIRQAKAYLEEKRAELQNFWKKYETQYSAGQRVFLLNILTETQETGLVEEEAKNVKEIQRGIEEYFYFQTLHTTSDIKPDTSNKEILGFFEHTDKIRETVYDELNELADVRYIFGQRVVFFVSGENDRQQGYFNTVFVVLIGALLFMLILEFFFIHKPMKDIMSFLDDLSKGKKGQRLYFSSPIREIKRSEEIINDIVSDSEKHKSEG